MFLWRHKGYKDWSFFCNDYKHTLLIYTIKIVKWALAACKAQMKMLLHKPVNFVCWVLNNLRTSIKHVTPLTTDIKRKCLTAVPLMHLRWLCSRHDVCFLKMIQVPLIHCKGQCSGYSTSFAVLQVRLCFRRYINAPFIWWISNQLSWGVENWSMIIIGWMVGGVWFGELRCRSCARKVSRSNPKVRIVTLNP